MDVANNDPGEQGTRFYLQLNLLLRGLNGPIRCQSFDNDEEYAEVFIDMFGTGIFPSKFCQFPGHLAVTNPNTLFRQNTEILGRTGLD